MNDQSDDLRSRQQDLLRLIALVRNANLCYSQFLAAVNSVLLDQLADSVMERFRETPGFTTFRSDSRLVRAANVNGVLESLGVGDKISDSDFAWLLDSIEASLISHTRKPIPLHVKWQLLAREYKCAHPGCECATALEIDHVVPVARGGGSEISNLRWLCRHHNASKGARRMTPEL